MNKSTSGRHARLVMGLALGFTFALALTSTLTARPLTAQERSDSARIAELERQIDAISREIERMSLGSAVVEADTMVMGFAPSASKVYRINSGLSIGGYGEILYEDFDTEREDGALSGKSDQIDALRGIVYLGYKFNDKLLFNSETEVEHGATGQSGSVSLEFAYLDYRLTENFGIRGGLLLSPMGLVNELHEPPIFLGAKRSITETRVIPSTWRENGIGFFGEHDDWSYRGYLLNSFDGVGGGSSNASGFSGEGLRGGRQKGSKALAEDFAGVFRLDYSGYPGLLVGSSIFVGGVGQGRLEDGSEVSATTTIWEGHVRYLADGWDVQGVFARSTVNEVERLNELKGLTGNESIGETLRGWYLQAGYDVLWSTPHEHQLLPYVRYEAVDTQVDVPTGFASNPANDLDVLSIGVAWKPIGRAIMKADYQIVGNEAETGVNQLNVVLGYLF